MKNDSNASFYLDSYKILEFQFKNPADDEKNIDLLFDPKGAFDPKQKLFIVTLKLTAVYQENAEDVELLSTLMESTFIFKEQTSLEELPEYFYSNSIAIVFPFLRAFVATLTTLAGVRQLIMPTLNLTGLQEMLKDNTTEIEGMN